MQNTPSILNQLPIVISTVLNILLILVLLKEKKIELKEYLPSGKSRIIILLSLLMVDISILTTLAVQYLFPPYAIFAPEGYVPILRGIPDVYQWMILCALVIFPYFLFRKIIRD